MLCSTLWLVKAQVKGWLMMEETQPKLQPLRICSHLTSSFTITAQIGSHLQKAQVPASPVTKVQLPDKFFCGSGRNSLSSMTVRTVAEEKMKPHIRGSSVMICCGLKINSVPENLLCPGQTQYLRSGTGFWNRLWSRYLCCMRLSAHAGFIPSTQSHFRFAHKRFTDFSSK